MFRELVEDSTREAYGYVMGKIDKFVPKNTNLYWVFMAYQLPMFEVRLWAYHMAGSSSDAPSRRFSETQDRIKEWMRSRDGRAVERLARKIKRAIQSNPEDQEEIYFLATEMGSLLVRGVKTARTRRSAELN